MRVRVQVKPQSSRLKQRTPPVQRRRATRDRRRIASSRSDARWIVISNWPRVPTAAQALASTLAELRMGAPSSIAIHVMHRRRPSAQPHQRRPERRTDY